MLDTELKLITVLVTVLTPFNRDAEQSLNVSVIPKYANYLAEAGVRAILIAGTTGEGSTMSVKERKELTEAWAEAVKTTKQHLRVQIGGVPIHDVLELARHAEKMKVGSLLVLPELFFKPFGEKELISYLKAVSDVAPNTPLMYYHTPTQTNINIHMGKFFENVGNQVPTLAGVKYKSHDILEAVQVLKADNGRFSVFFRGEELTLAGYAAGLGTMSCFTPNLYPKLPFIIRKLWMNNNISEAQKYQELYFITNEILTKYGSMNQSLKYAMLHRTSFDFGDARLPWLRNLSAKNASLLINELDEKVFSVLHSM